MKSVILLRRRRVLWCTAMAACLLSGFVLTTPDANPLIRSAAVLRVAQGAHSKPAASSAAQPRLVGSYGKLPLSFEVNKGQTDSTVKFLARGSGYSLFLTGDEAVLALRKSGVRSQKPVGPAFGPTHQGSADLAFRSAAFPAWLRSRGLETNARTADPETPSGRGPKTGSALHLLPTAGQFKNSFASNPESRTPDPESPIPAVLRMKLMGANPQARLSGLEELPGKSNYFIGNDPTKWRTSVPNYAKVKYANVYPGVDLVYYGNQGQLEYDFVVQPGADPRPIQLAINPHGQVGSRQKAVGSAMEAQDPAPAGQSTIDNPSAPTSGHERRPGGGHGRRRGHLPQARRLPAGLGRRLVTCHSSLVTGRRPLSPRG